MGIAPREPSANWRQRAAFYSIEQRLTAREATFWRAVLSDAGSALIAPGAAGELAHSLARPGLEVVAVDREPAMVAAARRRLQHHEQVTVGLHDLREIDLDRLFDFVVVPRGALQLFPLDEQLGVLEHLAAHVAPDGRLAIEMLDWNQSAGRDGDLAFYDSARPDGAQIVDWIRQLRPNLYLSRSRRQLHHPTRLILQFEYGRGPTPQQCVGRPFLEAEVVLWPLSTDGLRVLGAKAGLTLREEFGGYQRSHDPTSRHQILVFGR